MESMAIRLSDLRKFKGSLVYTVYREGKVLYVGRSNVGIDRPLETFHPAMSQCKSTDLIKLNFCKTARDAAKLETRLIQEFHPPLNVRKPNHRLIVFSPKAGGSCP
jgi:excinuclease UvrABC nuclease subunit